MMSKAQVSEASTGASPSRPRTSGRIPRGSRRATSLSGVKPMSDQAPCSRPAASAKASSKLGAWLAAMSWSTASVSAEEWNRAPSARSSRRRRPALVRLPLWGQRQGAVARLKEERLDARKLRPSGGGVAQVTEGGGAPWRLLRPAASGFAGRWRRPAPTVPRPRSASKPRSVRTARPAASWPRCCKAWRPRMAKRPAP